MEDMKIYSEDNTLIAIILVHNYYNKGLNFLTDSNHSLQLAYINNPAGHEVSKHCHPRYDRIISETMECLIVKQGEVEVTFYDNNQKLINSVTILSGDLVLFIDGGHSLKNIVQSELIEIRQGPFNPSLDKLKF